MVEGSMIRIVVSISIELLSTGGNEVGLVIAGRRRVRCGEVVIPRFYDQSIAWNHVRKRCFRRRKKLHYFRIGCARARQWIQTRMNE